MSNKPISRKKNIVDGKGTIKKHGTGLNSTTPADKESGNILKNIIGKIIKNEGTKEDEK